MKRIIILLFLFVCFVSCEKQIVKEQKNKQENELMIKRDSITDTSKCGCPNDIIKPPENPKPRVE